jgi:cytochrome c oxidase subunit 2
MTDMNSSSPRVARRAFLASATATLLAGAAAFALAKPRERTIKMVARKFVFVPNTIKVKKGEAIALQLTAPEVPMGINIPDFKVRGDIVPGKTTVVRFTPDRAGTFAFVCDVFCGDGHEDMQGTVVVE